MELYDRWDDWSSEGNERYITIELDDYGKVDLKRKENGFMYVMNCGNGFEVYRDADDGYRFLTKDEEDEVMDFAEEQFRIEAELDEMIKMEGQP